MQNACANDFMLPQKQNKSADDDISSDIHEAYKSDATVEQPNVANNNISNINNSSSNSSSSNGKNNNKSSNSNTTQHQLMDDDANCNQSNLMPSYETHCTDNFHCYAIPAVAIFDDNDSDSDDLTDSSIESPSYSSTMPTTTTTAATITTANNSTAVEVTANVTAHNSQVPITCKANTNAPFKNDQHKRFHNRKHIRTTAAITNQPNHMLAMSCSLLTDDNTSGSIATTTTDIELDAANVGTAATAATDTATAVNAMSISPHLSAQHTDVGQQLPAVFQKDFSPVKSALLSMTASHHHHHHHRRTLSASSYMSANSQRKTQSLPSVHSIEPRNPIYEWMDKICLNFKSSGIGEPSVYHALIVIFLEFFAWGLLAMPVISVLNQTFPDHTFLMNGLVMGIKGILSFLSAPLVGALSDIWGRKFFLLITVFFTCAPIPLMTINTWWFFAMISISGVFAVTFSVVFAYVADVTTVEERSRAYGLVSATFAASLVISPALGAMLMETYGETLVVALATAIAVLDVFFILVAVPESLPEKVRPSSWGAPISWEQADPFAALRKVGMDHTVLMQCVTVLLSYLPEAGQYSCIFVYLKLKMGFNAMEVAIFIAVVGILSISIQVTLGYLMRAFGAKRTIVLGLVLEMIQLLWYGFGSQKWMMWAAGILAALGSITYPAISAFVSIHSNPDRQGAVQGMVTGMRGLCNGLGPAMFGVVFYLFNVDLNDGDSPVTDGVRHADKFTQSIPGPPFVFGALMVLLAILVAVFIPEAHADINLSRAPSEKKRNLADLQ